MNAGRWYLRTSTNQLHAARLSRRGVTIGIDEALATVAASGLIYTGRDAREGV